MRLQLAIAAGVIAAGALVTDAAAVSPTPLRLEARYARAVFTDGDRFAVIERRQHIEILDTFTEARRRVSAPGCHVSSVAYFQTHVAAGRAALRCAVGPELLDLATGARTPLPARLTIGGNEVDDVYYVRVGEWWAQSNTYVRCGAGRVWCTVYVNHHTGEQRVVADDQGSEWRSFVDVDDPGLRRVPLCRPHRRLGDSIDRRIGGDGQRTYDAPYLLDESTPYRCGRHRKLRELPGAARDLMNLSAGLVTWGVPWPDDYRHRGLAYLFDCPTRKLYRWRVPRVARRAVRAGAAFHTRRRLIVAATLKADELGDPLTVRVYSARLPREIIRRLARSG